MDFELHPRLAEKTFVVDLPLCTVLMEDERHYPWFMLVPRRPALSRLFDLSAVDQLLLLKELDLVQKAVWDTFRPTQLNVAAIGNKTPQLHVHVIGRYATDPAWPRTVWDHPVRALYAPDQKNAIVQSMRAKLFAE